MKNFIQNVKVIYKFTKNGKSKLIKIVIFNLLLLGVSLLVPMVSAKIIVELTNNKLYQLLMMAVCLFLIENTRNFGNFFYKSNLQIIFREIITELQYQLCKETLKLENKVIDDNSSGVFIQVINDDANCLADIFSVISNYLLDIMVYIGYFLAIFIISKLVFIYALLFTILMYLLYLKRENKLEVSEKERRRKKENLTGITGELVRGIRDIKMLNIEKGFLMKIRKSISELDEKREELFYFRRLYGLLGAFLFDLYDLILIFIIVMLIKAQLLTITSALVLYNYAGRVSMFGETIDHLIEKIKEFNISAERVFSIINGVGYSKESFGDINLKRVNGDFEFKNVSFSYDKNKVLKNLSFNVKANETVAFVGKTGAGKTTIFNLLCKMYDNYDGIIKIYGYDIKTLSKDTIRGNITIISQNPYIFHMSIKDNLKLVKPTITKKEMVEACKAACLHDFIMTLPKKYNTIIGEGGINLSGGQRQRLAIARALVQKTEIILFDEATSALDNETQKNIQIAIDNMKDEYTILIIAHRLSTVINANRILFLEDGKIKASGTHSELLNNSLEYKKLYETEISKNNNKIV